MRRATYVLGSALMLFSLGLLVTRQTPSLSEGRRTAVKASLLMGAKSVSSH